MSKVRMAFLAIAVATVIGGLGVLGAVSSEDQSCPTEFTQMGSFHAPTGPTPYDTKMEAVLRGRQPQAGVEYQERSGDIVEAYQDGTLLARHWLEQMPGGSWYSARVQVCRGPRL
jgi:hypothetical protein